jgi:hypothetical protein
MLESDHQSIGVFAIFEAKFVSRVDEPGSFLIILRA